MTNDLKIYKELTMVELKDWTTIMTPVSVDDLLQACNSWLTFVKIDGKMVNVNLIAKASSEPVWEIESFILSVTDVQVKERLRDIVDTRKKMWHKTNWVKHLVEIYESRFWKL